MHPHRRLVAAVVTALVFASTAFATGAAHARGQLQTRQTGIDLPAGTRAARLVLANTGDAPILAQIRVYAWHQDGSDDQLERSDALVASPPIVEIAPGGEQLVRLVRPSAAAVPRERAYRVVVDELPGDPVAGEGSAVTVRMRYLLPAFVRAADATPAQLHCELDRQGEQPALACRNSGGRAARLGATRLIGRGGRELEVTPGLLGYVLAGSARRFSLDAAGLAALDAPTKLEVSLNGQPAAIDLALRR
ncbi:MAG: fimbria/pilus periplasmic chaperone [Proteobacteria bacterium]|nr:fimbria/pilus periplasmic chaperone [Pseudomonadota bacterium]